MKMHICVIFEMRKVTSRKQILDHLTMSIYNFKIEEQKVMEHLMRNVVIVGKLRRDKLAGIYII
jgi:hypothetical protein